MRISDWSSDACSSDLRSHRRRSVMPIHLRLVVKVRECSDLIPFASHIAILIRRKLGQVFNRFIELLGCVRNDSHSRNNLALGVKGKCNELATSLRSEEHTSELQSLMRNSSAVFCLKKKIK